MGDKGIVPERSKGLDSSSNVRLYSWVRIPPIPFFVAHHVKKKNVMSCTFKSIRSSFELKHMP